MQVIGCPKTIDGDLKNEWIETSFGFDTATKVYSEVIGNIQRDCNSAKKYYHFIKLMGRSASHIALECALQTQPNICIISEEVEAKNMTLQDVVNGIADVVVARAADGKNFGTVLIPEGLIEFIPAIKKLIAELNDMLADDTAVATMERKDVRAYVIGKLSADNAAVYASLPEDVALQLSLDRDPHGNVQVSLIETEKLLSDMVAVRLDELHKEGRYNGKFASQHHFFGYEGRCAAPSNFDADYCQGRSYGLHVERKQPHQAQRAVECRRHSCHHDAQYGTSSWRNEACDTESPCASRWCALPQIRFSARTVGRQHMLHLSRPHPVFRPGRGVRPAVYDTTCRTSGQVTAIKKSLRRDVYVAAGGY